MLTTQPIGSRNFIRMMKEKICILIFTPYYLPGFKAGGPIRSIANMVSWLGDEFTFKIVTTDRDLGNNIPYKGIEREKWTTAEKSQVFYVHPNRMGFWFWYQFLFINHYDVFYLNSFFSLQTVCILLIHQFRPFSRKNILLAPRGVFSKGALALKPLKKRTYILITKMLGLYKSVHWQASSQMEKKDILSVMGHFIDDEFRIWVAPNLMANEIALASQIPTKLKGALKTIFLSRISPKKNLDYLLKLLARVGKNISLDIYGPIEDQSYWHACQNLISNLPSNIQIRYCGIVRPESVSQIFSQYHLFVFPTKGENFGHVILEALKVGCPVLISDTTPWQDIEVNDAGWAIPLAQPIKFVNILKLLIDMDQQKFQKWSNGARKYAEKIINKHEDLDANRTVFTNLAQKMNE